MRPWFLAFALLISFAGCQPTAKQEGLSIPQYESALRDGGMHDVRVERNTRLPGQIGAAAAADLYVAGQHLLLTQFAPGKKADEYKGYFDGYKAQKWYVLTNQNLIFVAEPNTQQELVDTFNNLR